MQYTRTPYHLSIKGTIVQIRYLMLQYFMLQYLMLQYLMLQYFMLQYFMLQYFMLQYLMLQYFMLQYLMLQYLMLQYLMLQYLMLQYPSQALAYCERTGGKFEDFGPGGFPEQPLDASGEIQPSIYNRGAAVLGMPQVTHWRRPEDIDMGG